MAVSDDYREFVLEQLAPAGRVTPRAMFGGVGLYLDGLFFALIDDDTLYFKVDDTTRPDYESRNMQPLRPFKDKPDLSMTYYTVPADVLDEPEELVAWARRSVAIASKPKKRAKTRR